MAEKTTFSRRNFLQSLGKSLAALTVANTGVYVVGSAFKELDGSLTAGAKSCECLCWYQNFNCGYSGGNTAAESCSVMATTCAELNASGCHFPSQKRVQSCFPN